MKAKSKPLRTGRTSPVVSPARAAAFDILLRVERDSSYASELLHSGAYALLSSLDHSLTTELVMGVLRWRSVLNAEISGCSSQPLAKLDREILIALRIGSYQIRWLSRIPARAAINESVELVKRARKRSAAPFVNAILRKIAAANKSLPSIDASSAEAIAATSAHPAWLVERWSQIYGLEAAAAICKHNQSVPVTSIRLRTPGVADRLRDEGIDLAPGALLASSRRVLHGDVTKTPAYLAGLCPIQDEASQLVAALVGYGMRVLDCCAAPGGKTMAIADLNPTSQIIAADLHVHRARLLRKILRGRDPQNAAQVAHVDLIVADARHLPLVGDFDRVLADVPCSGTGTLSRNPEIKWRLTPEDLADLQVRQLAILRSAMKKVAPGGRLIYSTCSLEPEENQDVINLAIKEDASFRLLDCAVELDRMRTEGELIVQDAYSITRSPYLRTVPGVHPCEGFFAAILEKIS